LVDTLGAGDVFNAGLIHALLEGEDPRRALALAVELAGRKCGRQGLDGLLESTLV
jgi:ketohexokinase